MTLEVNEFLHRFCLHILPKGFRKVRYYGILASGNKPVPKEQQKKIDYKPEEESEKDYKATCAELVEATCAERSRSSGLNCNSAMLHCVKAYLLVVVFISTQDKHY